MDRAQLVLTDRRNACRIRTTLFVRSQFRVYTVYIYIYTDVEGLFLNMMVPEDLMDQVQSPLKKEAKEDDNRL